jgi:hypothetical protein
MAIPKWMKKTGCLTIGAFDSATTASQVGDRVEYVYDFGDNWRHVLELVDVGAAFRAGGLFVVCGR